MLRYRLLFGTLMIVAVLGVFWVDAQLERWRMPGWLTELAGRAHPPAGIGLLVVALLLIPFACRELARLLRAVRVHTGVRLISVAAIAACVTIYATPMMLTAPTGATIVATVLVAAFVITLLWHSRDGDPHGAISAAGATMFAIALLGLMPGFFLAIRRWHAGWVVLAIILITKSGDIGAYFTGRMVGRHKLIPWLSPKKTWEGLAGGVALAALVAVGFAWISQSTDLAAIRLTADDGERELIVRRYDLWIAALAGAFFALVGHAGDLMMSMFKRDAGVKDSGGAIPGFGGILDVIDSILLVAPVAFWMLELASRTPSEP